MWRGQTPLQAIFFCLKLFVMPIYSEPNLFWNEKNYFCWIIHSPIRGLYWLSKKSWADLSFVCNASLVCCFWADCITLAMEINNYLSLLQSWHRGPLPLNSWPLKPGYAIGLYYQMVHNFCFWIQNIHYCCWIAKKFTTGRSHFFL